MQKIIDDIDGRVNEIQTMIGLIYASVENIAVKVSDKKLPQSALPYDVLLGLDLVKEKLSTITNMIDEREEPKAA